MPDEVPPQPAEPAQIPVVEPVSEPVPQSPIEPVVEVVPTLPTVTEASTSEPLPAPVPEAAPTPPPVSAPAPVVPPPLSMLSQTARELLVKARAVMQTGKQKKLERIMAAIETNGKITNNEVERLVKVSDATATRYLSALEKHGRIKKVGKPGPGLVYIKV